MKHLVLGSAVPYMGVASTHKASKKSSSLEAVIASTTQGTVKDFLIDTTTLKAAAKRYNISPNIYDYVIASIPIVTSDFPNRNMQAMALNELIRFRNRFGRITYRTFVGKPTFQDHVNDDPYQAKGMIFDSIIKPVTRYNIAKVIILAAFDRSKDTALASDILKKIRKFHSMGAWVEHFSCSICGAQAATDHCVHFRETGKGNQWRNRLVYQLCNNIDFFESSSVVSPADYTAEGGNVFPMF